MRQPGYFAEGKRFRAERLPHGREGTRRIADVEPVLDLAHRPHEQDLPPLPEGNAERSPVSDRFQVVEGAAVRHVDTYVGLLG